MMFGFVLGMACVIAGIWNVLIWESVGMECLGLVALFIGNILMLLSMERS